MNGFAEGAPGVVIDLYAKTAVIHDHGGAPVEALRDRLLARLPWLSAVVWKPRRAEDPAERRGRVIFGATPDRRIREHGVSYAIDVLLNLDASFYLDTRLLRLWLLD